MAVPTRSTNEVTLDQFNTAMRQTPWYQQFLTSIGQNIPGVPARLSRSQQSQLERLMAQNGFRVPSGMHVDQGGNLNQRNRTARNIAIGAGIAGATLATMGAAGAFSGAAGAGAGAGGAAGGAGAAGAGTGLAGAGIGTGAGLAGTSLGAGSTLGGAGLAGAGIGTGAGLAGTSLGTGLAGTGIGTGAGLAGTTLGSAAGLGGLGAGAGLGPAAATGGSRLMDYLRTGSALAGSIGSNMAGNRRDRNDAASEANRAAQQQYATQQDALMRALGLTDSGVMQRAFLDLNQRELQQRQRQFALDAPTTRGRQALFGSLMQNIQPVQMSGLPSRISRNMPTITGGLTPAAINPDARAMGGLMARLALQNQQRGDSIDEFTPPPTTNFMGGLLTPPGVQGFQGEGRGESILGMLGLIGPAISAYRGFRANPAQPAWGTRG